MENGYWKYWGKARKEGEAGTPYHLLPYHSLDVAAVGKIYLEQHTALRADWAARLQIAEETFADWFVFFLSQHDLGKFSYRFQGLRLDLCQALKNEQPRKDYTVRHDTLGHLLYRQKIGPWLLEQGRFEICGTRYARRNWRMNLEIWAGTVTGHHGQPPKTAERQPGLEDHFSERDLDASVQFASECADLLLPKKPGELPDGEPFYETLNRLSWWLAGLSVLCDWVGSNEEFFRYRTEPLPLSEYWTQHAQPRAEKALRGANLLPRSVRPQTLTGLFKHLEPPAEPTPLQRTAANLTLAAAPQLFILEDVTGAGKTEAALMLAYRLIAAGRAEGFYLGLPTMATSNAMFRRIRDNGLNDKFFREKPNLVLAHSASRLEPVLETLSANGSAADGDYDRDESSSGSERSAWFADSRKKALLADMGVGTLDQALLAVLYSRHQALRLLGLVRKVLIVDEVHACDAYMLRLLEVLLAFHAAGGGCAILLSATLPRRIRQKLVDAYCEGLERRGPTLQRTDYPLLTWIAPDHHDEIDLDTRPEVARLVRVDTVHATETAREILLTARAENRCACWIRNTVDDAIAAHELLCQAGVPEDDLILFHARFVLADRMEIENKVLNCFGPDSGGEQRRGKILVATQVIEQSLDLDFDVMLSDLAPIDLLIQRAGRLRRHCRDMAGNKADKEGRSTPRLWIFGPEFTETPSADWFRAFLPGAAAVYPNHGHIWLTARFLQQTGAIAMPEGARDLIENVYGEDAEADVPPALQSSVTKVMGDDSAKQSMASANTITLEKGYRDEGFDLWDETRIPTRLEDQPSVTVRLTCRENGALRPWRDSSSRYDWELSQVSVRYSLFADEEHDPTLETAVETCRTNMPDRGKWSRLLVLERENGIWVGRAKNGKGETVRLCYDSEKGLRKA